MSTVDIAPVALVESRILVIRGQKVLLDSDLAALYEVTTGNLNKAVRRNHERFPEDFMFQLSPEETEVLIFQNGISNEGRGGRRFCPYAFTEQGIAMLSGVLTSKRAVEVNVAIMRTFVRLRQLLATHEELAHRLDQLEWRQSEQDGRVQYVFETIQQLIEAPAEPASTEPKRSIGFPTSQLANSVTDDYRITGICGQKRGINGDVSFRKSLRDLPFARHKS